MPDLLTELIDKQDTFEIVRDQVASILALESANQQTLATAAGKDPELWKFRTFLERSLPWQDWIDPENDVDTTPIVNVCYADSSFDKSASNVVSKQKAIGIFNIDCYGLGVSEADGSGGHIPSDTDASLEVHRTLRLVRNILMAAQNTYLQLRGTVWRRWPDRIAVFQPKIDNLTVQRVIGARLVLAVEYHELSPQVPSETLELLSVDILRTDDNELLVEADYDYTTT